MYLPILKISKMCLHVDMWEIFRLCKAYISHNVAYRDVKSFERLPPLSSSIEPKSDAKKGLLCLE